MREPIDEFARMLRRLRKRKGQASTVLSEAVGKHRTYIGSWEREARPVNKQALHRVCEVLELSEAERRRLFALADVRTAPEDTRHFYEPGGYPDANLLHALLEVAHEWPSQPTRPNPRSERAQLLVDAVAWILAKVVAVHTDILPPFSRVRWPEPLVRVGIVPSVPESASALDIPDAVLQEEMPFIDQLQEPVTQQDSWTQSLAMARAYRRLLFSDLDRARAVVATLQRWSYDRVQDLSECLTLGFRETAIQESFAIRDVDCRVIAAVGERSLAGYLWQMGNELPVNEPPARWACKWSPGDYMTLVTVTQVDRRGFKTYGAGQRLRDALFTARSTTWPYVLEQIGAHFGAPYKSEPDLETQLRSGELDDTTRQRVRAEPWRLAAVNEGAIIAYLQSFESSVPSLPGDEVPRPAGVRRNARPAPGRVDTKTSAGHRRKQTAKSKERGKRGQAKKTARPKVAKRATPGKNAKGKKKRKRTP